MYYRVLFSSYSETLVSIILYKSVNERQNRISKIMPWLHIRIEGYLLYLNPASNRSLRQLLCHEVKVLPSLIFKLCRNAHLKIRSFQDNRKFDCMKHAAAQVGVYKLRSWFKLCRVSKAVETFYN